MIRINSVGVVAGLVCVSLAMEGAVAQGQDGQEGQALRGSVGVVVESTDNRDASPANEQDNIDVFLRPRAELFLGSDSSFLELYYAPSLRYRSEPGDDQDETGLLHSAGLNGKYSLSERMRVRAGDVLSIADDPQIEESGRIMREDHTYTDNTVHGGMNYDVLKYSNIDLLLRNQIRRFDDEVVANRSDEDETSIRLQHRYSLTATLRTLLTGEYRMYSYVEDIRDFDSVVTAIGLENVFSPTTVGSVSVGWQTREYDNELLDGEGKPYVQAELGGRLNADLRIGMVAGYGLRDADAYPYASQEYTEARGYADAKLTQQLLLRLAATYRISTYDEVSGLLAGGDETVMVGDAELAFRLADAFTVLVGYRIEDIDADTGVGSSYVKNTARVGASVQF